MPQLGIYISDTLNTQKSIYEDIHHSTMYIIKKLGKNLSTNNMGLFKKKNPKYQQHGTSEIYDAAIKTNGLYTIIERSPRYI